MIRGAVYPVDLGDANRGHEQRGRRLGLVISIEQNAWSVVTIIPTSTSAQASVFRPEVVIAGRETKILIDQVRSIDVSYVTGELIDYLSRDDMAQVEHSLSRYFGLLRQTRGSTESVMPQAQPTTTVQGSTATGGCITMIERYVLGLEEIDKTQVALAGGKGAHLGELSRIEGIRGPAGFCVTTDAFRRIMAEAPSIDDQLDQLSRLDPDDREAIRTLSAKIRLAEGRRAPRASPRTS